MKTSVQTRGFSLIEVMVAMAILAVSLLGIFNLNSGAVGNHVYTKRLTVATLLARSKMTDIEQELLDKGFSNDDEEEGGDFSDEGWPGFKWRYRILVPETEGVAPEQIAMAIFTPRGMGGLGGGGEDDDDTAQGLGEMATLAAMFSPAAKGGAAGGADPLAAGGMMAALGPMAGLLNAQLGQMVDQLTKTVREVHLTVSWKEGNQVETIDLVTHVVSLGPGSDRNTGGGSAAAGPNAGLIPPNGIAPRPPGIGLPPPTFPPIGRGLFPPNTAQPGGLR